MRPVRIVAGRSVFQRVVTDTVCLRGLKIALEAGRKVPDLVMRAGNVVGFVVEIGNKLWIPSLLNTPLE